MPRISRLAATFTSFFVIVFGYFAYAIAIVPWIDPSGGNSLAVPFDGNVKLDVASRYRGLLEQYFHPGDWRLDEPRIIKTPDIMLLIGDHEVLGDGSLKVEPCTLILNPVDSNARPANRSESASKRTLVIESSQGAVLRFDRPVDLQRAEFGKFLSGVLIGDVRMTGHGDRDGSNGLGTISIETSDVQIHAERVETLSQVHVRFGNNHIAGHHLIVNLSDQDATHATTKKMLGGDIDLIELVHVSEIDMRLDSGDFDLGPRITANANDSSQSAAVSRLEVRGDGPLRIDLRKGTATLDDRRSQIDLYRHYNEGASDHLSCRQLTCYFHADRQDRESSELLKADNPIRSIKQPVRLRLERFIAVGDAVTLSLPRDNGHVVCEHLEYNLLTRRCHLESAGRIQVQFHDKEVEATALTYQPPTSGLLGHLEVTGPGWIRGRFDEKPIEGLWGGDLSLKPDRKLHRLTITGGLQFNSASRGKVTANESMDVWLQQRQSSPASEFQRNDSVRESDNEYSVIVRRIVAQRDVHLQADRLTAITDELDVLLVDPPGTLRSAQSNPRDGAGTNRPNAAIGAHRRHRGESRRVRRDESNESKQPYKVTGRRIEANLWRHEENLGQSEIRDLVVDGNAHLQPLGPSMGKRQLEIAGSKFHITQVGPKLYTVDVVGRSARLRSDQTTLFGEHIQLNQKTGLARIIGPGRAELPIDRDLSGKLLRRPTLAEIKWQDGLEAKGTTILAKGAVAFQTRDQMCRANSVDIELQQPIRFNDIQSNKHDADIREITATNDVFLANRTYDDRGVQESIQKLWVSRLTIDNQTGELQSAGAGNVHIVSRGAAFANGGSGDSTPSRDDPLTFVGINYRGGMSGNVNARVIHMNRQVRAITGPVASWDGSIEVGAFGEIPNGTVELTCDRLTVAREAMAVGSRATQPPMELRAVGNTEIRGSSVSSTTRSDFLASSQRLTYSQSKGQLILEGDGLRPAEITQRENGTTSSGKARKLMYWPKFKRWTIIDGRQIDSYR